MPRSLIERLLGLFGASPPEPGEVGDLGLPAEDGEVIRRRDYERTWKREKGQPARDYPRDPVYRRYRCSSEVMIDSGVYPVWYTDAGRTRFMDYREPGATRITFKDLIATDALREKVLEKIHSLGRSRPVPSIITEHCSSCGLRVVIDGCKGLLATGSQGEDVSLVVTEISGADWSEAKYDMKFLCTCRRASGQP